MSNTSPRTSRLLRRRSLSPGGRIVLAFCGVIIAGTLLLSLPISHTGAVPVTPFDALFTTTSAVCVTGLTVVDTGSAFSSFGQAVILLLIQTGGLGVAVLGVAIAVLARKQMTLQDRALIRESWNMGGFGGLGRLFLTVLLLTAALEATGALIGWWFFSSRYSTGTALWLGVFHSVSSFNNAGFDILGTGDSLIRFGDTPSINLLTMGLIITGGLGYLVLIDLFTPRKHMLRLQTKLVLLVTTVLLVGGTLLLKLTDSVSWMTAFFQSVSARTAGFASMDLSTLSNAGVFVMCILMFIGASPGSTGGGIKTTTVFAVFLALRASAVGGKRQAFRRQVPEELCGKAFLVVTAAGIAVVVGTLLLCVFEPEQSMRNLFFEAVSAFGTVGLSLGVTPMLGAAARVVIITLMFCGRLGPMTIAAMWVFRRQAAFRYSEENFMIG